MSVTSVCACVRARVGTCVPMTVRFVGGERADTLAHICSCQSLFGTSGWRTRGAPPVPSQWRRKGENKEMEFIVGGGSISLRY